MTLTAQWTPQSWNIRYYESFDGTNLGNEITGLTPDEYTYGVETSFCADAETIVQKANKTGYTWLGWWSKWSSDAQDPIIKAEAGYSGEFSLFAKWEENTPVTPPTQGGEVCVTFEGSSNAISYTSGVFTMYAANSDGRIGTEESWATEKTDCSGTEVYAFDDNRFLVKVSVPITSIHFFGYNKSERIIESVKTSTTADKGSYSEAALVGDTKIGPTTGCQEFKINFSEAIPANTYIWVELSNAMVISTICYTPAPSTPSTYTVTYECNGATSGCPSNATEQTALPNPLPIPTKTGYEFGGWYTDSELTTAAIAGATLSANITLYAQWTENTPVTPDPEPEECTETTITYNLVTHNNKTASQSVSPSGTITSLTGATAIGAAESNTGDPNSSFADYSERYGASATNDNVSDGVTFTFDVPSGYVFKPTAINTNLMCYGVGGSGDTHYYQFVGTLSDATTTIEGEVYPNNADGANADIAYTIPNNASLSGTVTLRLNAVKKGGNYQSFRIKSPITIVGDLCSVDCSTAPAATITWNTQPANGQVGSADFAYAVSCSDGSAVTVTSADPSIATIVDGKLHYVAAGTTHLVASATDACGNEITQNSNDFTVTAASVEPNPGTGEEKYYYGQVAIQNGALVKGITNGMIQFFTVTGGVVENSTALSISSTPSAAGIYYNSNNLTHEELSKSSNWGSSSTANRYIQGMKFKDATTYTLKLGSKTATSIRFYGWCGSSSRKLTIGGVEYTSSSNKNTFFAHEFVKNGSFTGDISISGSGDFYGIIVIDITSLPSCTTPVLSDLENPKVCPGNNVSWTANNTATLQDGETIAYQWNKMTGDKVWVINAAHGGTAISKWQEGKIEYNEFMAVYSGVKQTLEAEIAAGHFVLREFGYFWCQGCADTSRTAEEYVKDYLAMHESLKDSVRIDHDNDPNTAEKELQFGAIVTIRSGRDYQSSYRDGVYSDTTTAGYYYSFKDMKMSLNFMYQSISSSPCSSIHALAAS